MPNIENLKRESLALTESDRGELALALIQSFHGPNEEGAESAWDEEIEKRATEIKRGEIQGRAAEDVFDELRSKYP